MKLQRLLRRLRSEDDGVLSFEWILLITVVTIGIVGGISAVRDAVISELGDVAGGIVAVDQSYSIAPDPCFQQGGFEFQDTECNSYTSCRPTDPIVSQNQSP